jgi:hypothetical protein
MHEVPVASLLAPGYILVMGTLATERKESEKKGGYLPWVLAT